MTSHLSVMCRARLIMCVNVPKPVGSSYLALHNGHALALSELCVWILPFSQSVLFFGGGKVKRQKVLCKSSRPVAV